MTDGRPHPAILASDAEREAAVDRLPRAVVEGRREQPNRRAKLLGKGDSHT